MRGSSSDVDRLSKNGVSWETGGHRHAQVSHPDFRH